MTAPLPAGSRPGWADLRSVVALALPVATVQVGLMAMGVADTLMVGRASSADLAAVALGNLYFFLVAIFGMGVLMVLDPLVAQAVGAGDDAAVTRSVQRGLVLCLVLTVLASVLLLPAGLLFTLARQPEEVVPLARGYAWAAVPGVLPFYAFVVFRQTLQAMGRLRPIVWTILWANLLNVLLNWILIFGNLGAPRLGAVGSSLGSSGARWFMAVFLLAAAWTTLGPHLRSPVREAIRWKALSRMSRVGAPIGIHFQVEFGAFAMTGLMMGWLGTVPVAGHQVALNLAASAFMVPLGIAGAGAVLVGRAVGVGDSDRARRAAGASLLLGLLFMLGTGALFLGIPDLLARAYTNDEAVLAVAAVLIPVAGLFQIFDGLQAVAAGVLRGVGDTRLPMILNLVGFWGVGLPVGAYLAFRAHFGPEGLWWGLAVGLAAVAVLLLIRTRFRLRGDLQRLQVDGPAAIPSVPVPGSSVTPTPSPSPDR